MHFIKWIRIPLSWLDIIYGITLKDKNCICNGLDTFKIFLNTLIQPITFFFVAKENSFIELGFLHSTDCQVPWYIDFSHFFYEVGRHNIRVVFNWAS